MAHKKTGGGGSTLKSIVKLGAVLVGGAVLGEVLSPLTGPVSGASIGMLVVGLPVYGLNKHYAKTVGIPALAVQGLKMAQSGSGVIGTPVLAAKASLAGATRALKSAGEGPGASNPVDAARRLRG